MALTPARFRDIPRTIALTLAVALSVVLVLTSTWIARAEESADSAASQATHPGTYVSLEPARVLDTRVGNGAARAPVGAFATVSLQVTGRGGVPAADVAAVVVNVTVTGPTAHGFITVYPAGASQPTASNLNFTAGKTIPNLVTVKVSGDGKIAFTNNSAGSVELIADVAGYYLAGTPTEAGAFVSLDPARLLDTRAGNGAPKAAVEANGTVDLQVTGRGGVPDSGVSAVIVNVTVTSPAMSGFITVYPSGSAMPNASNLNFAAGQTIPNLVTARVGGNGKVKISNNSAGTVHLIADVAGYYLDGAATVPGAFVSLDPARILDTRVGNGAAQSPVSASGTVGVQVADRGSVPPVDAAAVVVNVTVTQPANDGFVTVYPHGTAQPNASNLNFSGGQNIPNLVTVKVGGNGKIDLTNNSAGSAHLIADVAGYFLGSPDELDEVWPSGWIFDDCGTDWDALLLLATPGIVYSPSAPVYSFEGEYFYEFLPDATGKVVVTASAEPGYVMLSLDSSDWVMNEDGSVTGTMQFTDDWCVSSSEGSGPEGL